MRSKCATLGGRVGGRKGEREEERVGGREGGREREREEERVGGRERERVTNHRAHTYIQASGRHLLSFHP